MIKNNKWLGKKLAIIAMSAMMVASVGIVIPNQYTYAAEAGAPAGGGVAETETSKDTDIVLTGVNAPVAKYGEATTIGFVAKVKGEGYITSISPVVSDTFPFESNDAAYMVVEGDATTTELKANYNFMVRSDVATGYQAVEFNIEYVKNGTPLSIVKTVNVKFEGAPEPTEEVEEPTTEAPVSTPRVIVTGYKTDVEKVLAGEKFQLTLYLQNTSNRTAVSNMKVSLETTGGEFLPTSGSSTKYISSIGAGQTAEITVEMSALATLEPKPYILTVNCAYEDNKLNPFESVEHISIPVYQEAKITVTEVSVAPDQINLYDQGSVSFSINNLGSSVLTNVQARVEGDTVECEDCFVGNIAAGSTGYADVMVTGVASTTDDGIVKLIVTYEDSAGEECTYEEEITVFVAEEFFEEEFYDYTEEPAVGMGIGGWIIGLLVAFLVLVAVIVVVVILIVKRKKRKALEEAETLEDEIDEELLLDADKEN